VPTIVLGMRMVGTARKSSPLPTLVLGRIITLLGFRKERPGPGGHPSRAADRRIVAHRSL